MLARSLSLNPHLLRSLSLILQASLFCALLQKLLWANPIPEGVQTGSIQHSQSYSQPSEWLLQRKDALDSSLPVCFKDGSRCLRYQVEVAAEAEIAIALIAEFAPYVVVLDSEGEQVSTGIGKLGQNWMRVKLPRAGAYRLVVSTVQPEARGELYLTVRRQLAGMVGSE